jgi:DNA-3-methyladenine glycosylase II
LGRLGKADTEKAPIWHRFRTDVGPDLRPAHHVAGGGLRRAGKALASGGSISAKKKAARRIMVGRIIETADCVAEGAAWLAAREPRFATALALTGPLPLRRRPGGFGALLDAIVGQQVSVASARAIAGRLEAAGLVTAAAVAAADEAALRACGLSRPKLRYLKALAVSGLDYAALETAPEAEVVDRLVAVPGIGRWTAEIYVMFALGRADAFAAGDLALQEAARMVFELEARPPEAALRRMAEDWRPWRSVAARLLWAYYRAVKLREGVV